MGIICCITYGLHHTHQISLLHFPVETTKRTDRQTGMYPHSVEHNFAIRRLYQRKLQKRTKTRYTANRLCNTLREMRAELLTFTSKTITDEEFIAFAFIRSNSVDTFRFRWTFVHFRDAFIHIFNAKFTQQLPSRDSRIQSTAKVASRPYPLIFWVSGKICEGS